MLLLLRTLATGVAAATLGIGLGLTASGSGTSATLGISLGLTPPEAVELQVTDVQGIQFGLVGIPLGFTVASATVKASCTLGGRGGFGASPTIPLNLGLSGTVGSFFDGGNTTLGIAHGLSAPAVQITAAAPAISLGLRGTPIISGGTISSAANLPLKFDLAAVSNLGTVGILVTQMDLSAEGVSLVISTVESMILTFAADDVRMFFRKK